mmetsp:Transcript_1161/g.4600  ORF Transcript_1161/g.4600 Transcript_1161/m.4600 type:complete len:635 (-) Transcript_1161:687-2591(-)
MFASMRIRRRLRRRRSRAAHDAVLLVGQGARELGRHERLLLHVRVRGRLLPVFHHGGVFLVARFSLLLRLRLRRGAGVDGELHGVGGGARAQVVHARLEALLPGVEVQRGELTRVGIGHVHVERLRLVDERAAVGGHVHQHALLDLPHRLVNRLEVLGQVQALHGAVVGDEVVLQRGVPQTELGEVVEEVVVHHGELTGKHAARVDVGGVRLEALVVAEDLRGGRGGHGRDEQRVAHAVGGNLLAQAGPVVAVAAGHLRDAPHVRLEDALGHGRVGVGFVRAVHGGDGVGLGERGEVNRLENLRVELLRFGRVEGHAEQDEHVRETLHAEADGAVAHVGALRGVHGVVVDVDDAVQVARRLAGDLGELGVVEVAVLGAERAAQLLRFRLAGGGRGVVLDHEAGQRDGREVAHRGLLGGGELDDLRAQVGGLDGAEVLLVGLAVARILEEHVGVARLNLRLEDGEPELLRLDGLLALARLLVGLVELLELLAPAVGEAGALVGAHERPLAVALDALHEQVVGPEAVEKVARARLLLAVVLTQVEPVEDVRVPGLEVHRERALALAAALVDVARGVVEHAEHGDDPVGGAVSATDVRRRRADVVDGQADAAGGLGDARALLEGVVDALDGVLLHGD